jgi:hypothetical protein
MPDFAPALRGLLGFWLANITHHEKFHLLLFSKSLEVHNKLLEATTLSRTDKHKENSKQQMTIYELCEIFIFWGSLLT